MTANCIQNVFEYCIKSCVHLNLSRPYEGYYLVDYNVVAD